jgi:hypothetical protein
LDLSIFYLLFFFGSEEANVTPRFTHSLGKGFICFRRRKPHDQFGLERLVGLHSDC